MDKIYLNELFRLMLNLGFYYFSGRTKTNNPNGIIEFSRDVNSIGDFYEFNFKDDHVLCFLSNREFFVENIEIKYNVFIDTIKKKTKQ